MIFMFLILINVAFSKTKNNNVLIFYFLKRSRFVLFENNNRFVLMSLWHVPAMVSLRCVI